MKGNGCRTDYRPVVDLRCCGWKATSLVWRQIAAESSTVSSAEYNNSSYLWWKRGGAKTQEDRRGMVDGIKMLNIKLDYSLNLKQTEP